MSDFVHFDAFAEFHLLRKKSLEGCALKVLADIHGTCRILLEKHELNSKSFGFICGGTPSDADRRTRGSIFNPLSHLSDLVQRARSPLESAHILTERICAERSGGKTTHGQRRAVVRAVVPPVSGRSRSSAPHSWMTIVGVLIS